jgi:hypothetical protein
MGAVPIRRSAARSLLLLGAAAAGGAAVVACSAGHDATTDAAGQASCAAPFLRADQRGRSPEPHHGTTLGGVARGDSVTVYGRWYFGGPCRDVNPTGARRPATAVPLLLTTADGRTVTLASATPGGRDAAFTATIMIPADAAMGQARISDGEGHYVRLVIAGS